MAHRVCPWWLGYGLLIPLRRFREDPVKLLGAWVREGMLVLEPGCGMGFFTLALARMVGPTGRIVAVDLQERMLGRLRQRAKKAGLAERLDARLATPEQLGIGDFSGRVDLCVAVHVVHEVPDAGGFFSEVFEALKPGGRVVFIEPTAHVSERDFEASMTAAVSAGLEVEQRPLPRGPRSALLRRPMSSRVHITGPDVDERPSAQG